MIVFAHALLLIHADEVNKSEAGLEASNKDAPPNISGSAWSEMELKKIETALREQTLVLKKIGRLLQRPGCTFKMFSFGILPGFISQQL